jgi:hypothetical protein
MKVFKYSMYQSYNDYFDWCGPEYYTLGKEVDYNEIEEIEAEYNQRGSIGGSYSGIGHDCSEEAMGYYFHTCYEGSCEERGFVVAKNRDKAQMVLDKLNRMNIGYKPYQQNDESA